MTEEFDAGCACVRGWLRGCRCATYCSASGAAALRPLATVPAAVPLCTTSTALQHLPTACSFASSPSAPLTAEPEPPRFDAVPLRALLHCSPAHSARAGAHSAAWLGLAWLGLAAARGVNARAGGIQPSRGRERGRLAGRFGLRRAVGGAVILDAGATRRVGSVSCRVGAPVLSSLGLPCIHSCRRTRVDTRTHGRLHAYP